jgi:hypothetical protein
VEISGTRVLGRRTTGIFRRTPRIFRRTVMARIFRWTVRARIFRRTVRARIFRRTDRAWIFRGWVVLGVGMSWGGAMSVEIEGVHVDGTVVVEGGDWRSFINPVNGGQRRGEWGRSTRMQVKGMRGWVDIMEATVMKRLTVTGPAVWGRSRVVVRVEPSTVVVVAPVIVWWVVVQRPVGMVSLVAASVRWTPPAPD